MTYAPVSIMEARRLLLDHLPLEPEAVGIVGSARHVAVGTSYHLGADQLRPDAYSRRTARDRAGLSNAASAIDIGTFTVTVDGRRYTLRQFTLWLFDQCRFGAADCHDIREVIGTVDGRTVLRYDREDGVGDTPAPGEADDSHLTHTHISYYRDSEHRSKAPLFERWLIYIGVIDVNLSDIVYERTNADGSKTKRSVGNILASLDILVLRAEGARIATAETLARILTEVSDDLALPVTLTPEQVTLLVEQLAARLPSAEAIAEATVDEHAGRLAD